jgi:hypothetical protein
MDEDIRLNAQLKSLGKKLFQFRDLVAKIEIPDAIPAPPQDAKYWEGFVHKCSSAITVLKQVQAALTPDMYHLAVFPGEKVWRNPAAVPDLLGLPERVSQESQSPLAVSREDVIRWNTSLEEANAAIENLLQGTSEVISSNQRQVSSKVSSLGNDSLHDPASRDLIQSLFSSTSRERASRS